MKLLNLPTRARATRAAGFTVVEMMIASVALAVMSAGVVGVSIQAKRAMDVNGTLQRTHTAGKRCLEKLQRHLRAASFSTMQSMPEGFEAPQSLDTLSDYIEAGGSVATIDNLIFQNFTVDPDAPDGIPVLSDPFTLDVAESQSDPNNGVDDDGDGFTDEMRLILSQPDGQDVTLSEDVATFSCALEGRTLTLFLSRSVRSPEGTLFTIPTSLSVEIRND